MSKGHGVGMELLLGAAAARLGLQALTSIGGPVGFFRSRRKVKVAQDLENKLYAEANRLASPVLVEIRKYNASSLQQEQVAEFMKSYDCSVFARGLMVAILTSEIERVRPDLEHQFISCLVLNSNLHTGEAEVLGRLIFSLLLRTFTNTFHEFRRAAPNQTGQMRELALAEKNAGYLKNLATRSSRSLLRGFSANEDVLTFLRHYASVMHSRTGYLVPASLDSHRRVPIEDLYVPPRFVATSTEKFGPISSSITKGEKVEVDLDRVIRRAYRTVVLGDPGAGKSTLAQKLAHDFSDPKLFDLLSSDEWFVPFIVTVRDYEKDRLSGRSVIEHIDAFVNSDLNIRPPAGVIEFLFTTGRAFVVFDGLDELLETHNRKSTVAAIESFSENYPTITILTTSRKIGYREAPLNADVFSVVELGSFDNQGVATYVAKWFALESGLTSKDRQSITESFLLESESVADLRANPLMLSLLCNIYRGVRSIPRNRADLYEQCANLLFERWDASRGILPPGTLKSDARIALQDTAYWIYTSVELVNGVPRRQLHKQLSNFWLRTRYESEPDAEDAATELLGLWRGRAWVLTDAGTTAAGEELFCFTHRTFLEYFAAVQLVRKNSSPQKLWEMLAPRVSRREWDVVAEIAIQIINQSVEGATDTLFRLLLDECKELSIQERYNLLLFGARAADVLMPSPGVVRLLAQACVDLALLVQPNWPKMPTFAEYTDIYPNLTEEMWEVMKGKRSHGEMTPNFENLDDVELGMEFESIYDPIFREGSEYHDSERDDWIIYERLPVSPEDALWPLVTLLSSDSARFYVEDEVVTYCAEIISGSDSPKAARAFLLGMSLDLACAASGTPASVTVIGRIDRLEEVVESLRGENFWVPVCAARNGIVSLSELVQTEGLRSLFCSSAELFYRSWESSREAFAYSLARRVLAFDVEGIAEKDQEILDVLREIGSRSYLREEAIDVDWMKSEQRLFDGITAVEYSSTDSKVESSLAILEDLTPSELSAASSDEEILSWLKPAETSVARPVKKSPLTNEELLGAVLLFAALLEYENWRPMFDHSDDRLTSLNLGPLQKLEHLFIARGLHSSGDASLLFSEALNNAGDAMRDLGLESDAISFLIDWAEGYNSLTITRIHGF